jgi:betaine-aldehyde dehydrogenase
MMARNYIGGEWIAGSRRAETINPSSGEVVGSYAVGSRADAEQARGAAREAFERGGWSNNPRRRAAALLSMADQLQSARKNIVATAVAESGKRTVEIKHEVDAALSELRYYAGVSRTIFGRVQEVDEGALSMFAREPIGVVGIIVPWNAPITLLIRSLGPVLAAGCTCVIKPAPQTALTNSLMIEAFRQVVELPTGVINSVNDDGSEIGATLVADSGVDAISFTGSHATAVRIMQAAAGTLKRLNLELGGKAPAIVFDDADLSAAVPAIMRGALAAAGQMCTAVTRVLVQSSVYDELANKLSTAFRALRVGPADAEASEMGPLIDAKSRERLLHVIEGHCAAALVRGLVPDGVPTKGNYLTPTLVPVEDLGSPLVQEELFGPLVTLERFSTEAEAVQRANATKWGLAASVWTRDGSRGFRVARSVKAGTVWLNGHNRLFAEAETGGYKQSGLGRLHGLEGLNDFLETKHIFLEPGWIVGEQM